MGSSNVLLFSLSPAYGDMFPHKHAIGKFPFPIPPIPGWDPDTNPWDDYLYPPLNPKPKELTRHKGEWRLFFPLKSSYNDLSFSPGISTFLQVNPRSVWPATVRLSMALASPSLQSWSTLHVRRKIPMGTLYGMITVRMVRSWRPQVLSKSPARPAPQNTTTPYYTAILVYIMH